MGEEKINRAQIKWISKLSEYYVKKKSSIVNPLLTYIYTYIHTYQYIHKYWYIQICSMLHGRTEVPLHNTFAISYGYVRDIS